MVEYYIEAIDQQGRPQSLTLAAKNSTVADELVRSQGLQPTLITHAKTHARQLADTADAHRRRRLFSMGGLALVALVLLGGIGVRLQIRRLEQQRGFTLDAIRGATAEASAAGSATGTTQELTGFARDVFAAMHVKFPGLVRSVYMKSETLMFVYLIATSQDNTPEVVQLLTRVMVEGMQTQFQSGQSTVLVIQDGRTVADARASHGETTVNMHETP